VQWLAVSSDKGTVHIFSRRVRVDGEDSSSNEQRTLEGPLVQTNIGSNASSSFSFMKGISVVYICSWFVCSE
jgi:hypothetical protein